MRIGRVFKRKGFLHIWHAAAVTAAKAGRSLASYRSIVLKCVVKDVEDKSSIIYGSLVSCLASRTEGATWCGWSFFASFFGVCLISSLAVL